MKRIRDPRGGELSGRQRDGAVEEELLSREVRVGKVETEGWAVGIGETHAGVPVMRRKSNYAGPTMGLLTPLVPGEASRYY